MRFPGVHFKLQLYSTCCQKIDCNEVESKEGQFAYWDQSHLYNRVHRAKDQDVGAIDNVK